MRGTLSREWKRHPASRWIRQTLSDEFGATRLARRKGQTLSDEFAGKPGKAVGFVSDLLSKAPPIPARSVRDVPHPPICSPKKLKPSTCRSICLAGQPVELITDCDEFREAPGPRGLR